MILEKQQKIITPRVVIQLMVFIVVLPFLPLIISWQWDWWEAWAYAIINVGGFAVSRLMAARRHPDLIAERARFTKHENIKPWDRTLAPVMGIGGALIPLVAGLDELLHWSPEFSMSIKIIAFIILLAGYALGFYALVENRFFSGMVRIQSERGHHVVSGGPYRWVRHPGYAGAILSYLATPLILDSAWTYLPSVFLTIVIVIRTALEDKVLHNELQGYPEYAGRVRFRLFPGVW